MPDNTVKRSKHFISVKFAGSQDFDVASIHANGIRLAGIHFFPSSATDKLFVRDGQDGPEILRAEVESKVAVYRPCSKLPCTPFIDFGECQFDTPADALVVFDIFAAVE